MATAGSLLSEDQFLCSICLDVFTQPVSLPCGHNFCKACITDCWNSITSGLCQCPMCKEKFNRRPELRVNCFISEMADHFRKSVQVKEEQEREDDVPREMLCDLCMDPKLKAAKSCLVCLTSYCETHLEPHHRVATLKNHQLVEPLGSMESRMCKKHNKILELFCRDEQRCICMLCSQTDHRSHNVVALEDESGKRKKEMGKGKTELEQKIQEREQKLQKIRRSAELNKEVAEKETADGTEVLTALVASIQKRHAELLELIERKQKEVQQNAELSSTELEKEIAELKITCRECDKISHSEDHLQVLMYSLPSPSTSPPCSDWSKVLMDNKLCAGTVRGAVTKMEKTINEGMEALIKQMEERHRQVSPEARSSPQPPSSPEPFFSIQPPSIKPPSLQPHSVQTSRGMFQTLAKRLEEHHQVRPRARSSLQHPSIQPPSIKPPSLQPPSQQTSRGRFQTPAKQYEEHTRSSLEHHSNVTVTCDACECDISSTYHHHCPLCRNYDLCNACFSIGFHQEHRFVLKKVFGNEPYITL